MNWYAVALSLTSAFSAGYFVGRIQGRNWALRVLEDQVRELRTREIEREKLLSSIGAPPPPLHQSGAQG